MKKQRRNKRRIFFKREWLVAARQQRKRKFITSRCGLFYTCKLFKEFFEVLEVFGGASFRHVLAGTTTGRFS